MFVGVARLTLQIADSGSLKSKRQVLRRITDRLKARFNVSVAEVEDQDLWQRATIALAVVSADRRHVDEQVEKMIHFVEEMYVAPLIGRELEILAFGDQLFGGGTPQDDGSTLDQRAGATVPLGHSLGLGQAPVLAGEGQLQRAPVVGRRSAGLTEELIAEGEDLQLPADEGRDVHLLDEVEDLLDLLVHVPAVRAHHRQGDGGPLPEVLVLHLGHRDVEARLEAIGDPPEDLSLGLQRTGVGDLEGEARDADEHDDSRPPGGPETRP